MVKEVIYQIDAPPEYGRPLQLSEGIYMLRLPLPFALDHVNVWLLEADDHWSVVDCGLGTPECMAIWDDLLGTFLASKPVKTIVLTHYHPDHVGLSGDLAAHTGARVLMSRTEWLQANMLYYDQAGLLGSKMLDYFKRHGLPDSLFEQMQFFKTSYRDRCATLPENYQRIKHGDEVELGGDRWQCIEGRGHSPEHVSLYNPKTNILIAGDHVLPKITPNIPLPLQERQANPIEDYLRSLDNFAHIDDLALVLPSHRLPFKGCRTRIGQLRAHHADRLETLLAGCQHPVSAYQLLPVLFGRELDPNQMTFAMLEALSHLVYLQVQGQVTNSCMESTIKWHRQRGTSASTGE